MCKKGLLQKKRRFHSADVNWTFFLCGGIGEFSMNILVKDAHSFNPKYAQQLLACIGGLMRHELSCNDPELMTIDIRRNGVVVAHIYIKKALNEYHISLEEAS